MVRPPTEPKPPHRHPSYPLLSLIKQVYAPILIHIRGAAANSSPLGCLAAEFNSAAVSSGSFFGFSPLVYTAPTQQYHQTNERVDTFNFHG